MLKTKVKKTDLQKKKDNPFSSYWGKKCDDIFGKIFHEYCVTRFDSMGNALPIDLVCAVGQAREYDDPCSGKIEMAHIVSREIKLLRWDFKNVLALCSYHHKYSRICSSHNGSALFYLLVEKHYPEQYHFLEKYIKSKNYKITKINQLPWTFREKYQELLNRYNFLRGEL